MRKSKLPIAILSIAAMVAQGSAASSEPFEAVLERETGGLFGRMLEKQDADFAIANYPVLISAFVRIEDAFFDAVSPDANLFPAWYAERLGAIGLHGLATPDARTFLEGELESGDFDRVVHAYYLLGRSRLPLLVSEAPTSLWQTMIATARADPENRYWISLALAEANMLPSHAYDVRHTKMATRTESVRERFTKNADFLGPRIVRVLGLSERDVRVSHLHIGYAEKAAARRVLERQMAQLGPDAAYQSIRDELERMEKGEFESKRFVSIMQEDLPFLHEQFGAPKNAGPLVETLRSLCRGLGQNRMELWNAADAVARLYEPAIASENTTTAKPPARPDASAIRAMGAGALGHLMSTLTNADDPDGVRHLLGQDVIPAIVAEHPPDDPSSLRRAIRDAYHRVGNPPEHHAAFLRAVESLGPEASAQAAVSRETTSHLHEAFAASHDAPGFARAYERFRQASNRGKLPRTGADPDFVAAFTAAAMRVIEAEDRAATAAEERARAANAEGKSASAAIEEAVAAVAAANLEVQKANEQVGIFDGQQRAAMTARNDAVTQLNQAVDRANAARGLDAAKAHTEARQLGKELSAEIEEQDALFEAAARALEEAEQRGAAQAERARAAGARAKAETVRAKASFEAEQKAAAEAHNSRARFKAALGRLIAGLGFVGIEATPTDSSLGGKPSSEPSVAELATLLQRGDDPALRQLAARALALLQLEEN